MSQDRVPGESLYRLLLRLHPRRFRDRYDDELVGCFRDAWRSEAAGRSRADRVRFWVRTVSGTLGTALRQRTSRDDPRQGGEAMDGLVRDVRVGIRSLLRRPGWSSVVILTLGLGMGATVAVASIFHGILLAPLPWGDDDRLTRLYLRNVVNGSERLHLSAPAARELRDLATSLEAVAAVEGAGPGVDIAMGDRPERLRDLRVSHGYFDVLGARPVAGRLFRRSDETETARMAIVVEAIADRYLGGAAAAVGNSLILDAEPHTVIGVVPDGLEDPLAGPVDVWRPTPLAETDNTWDNNYLDAYARLAPGVSLEEAQAELRLLARRHAELGAAAAEKEFMILPLRDELVGSTRPLLLALLGAVAFLLLLTCSNVASLLLARAATRERELAIRKTLGSTRGHLIRHFSVEACLVALAGGVCGLVVGRVGIDALLAIAPADLPLSRGITLGWGTAAVGGGLAVALGLALGFTTAVPYAHSGLGPALFECGRSGQGGRAARRARTVLVIVDVALAVVLLVGAGVLLRTLQELQNRPLGVDPEGVAAFQVQLPDTRYPTADLRIGFHDRLDRRLEAIPGVAAAGATSHLPVTGPANTWGTRRAIAVGQPAGGDNIAANQRIAGGRYFEAVGMRLIAGRFLDERDGPDAPRVVVVNDGLARTLFGDEDPVGQLLRVGPLYPEIVGVVEDVALTARLGPGPMVFHSYDQFGAGRRWPMTQVIRNEGDAPVPWDAIRTAVAEVDPQAVLDAPRTLDEVIAADIGDERFAALLLQSFAGLALLLASLGLYGLLAHSVERRRHEIGVRMALGADRGKVRSMIVAHGLALMVVGVVIGLVAAAALSRLLDFLLFGVSSTDPVVFVAVPALLLMVAAVASYLPARHATRVDPATSLEAT